MTFASLTQGQPIPPDGEFEIVHNGKRYAVVHHPRIHDHWMAFMPPADWRDAGMKKFATRAAAVRRVLKAMS
jgi:hypothetical protein